MKKKCVFYVSYTFGKMCVFVPCNANFIVAVLKWKKKKSVGQKNKMKPSNFVVIKKVAWSFFDCSEFYKIASKASQIYTVQRYLFEISRQKLTFNGH